MQLLGTKCNGQSFTPEWPPTLMTPPYCQKPCYADTTVDQLMLSILRDICTLTSCYSTIYTFAYCLTGDPQLYKVIDTSSNRVQHVHEAVVIWDWQQGIRTIGWCRADGVHSCNYYNIIQWNLNYSCDIFLFEWIYLCVPQCRFALRAQHALQLQEPF